MAPPPVAVLRRVNPVVLRVLSSPVGRRVGALVVVEFVGRRSGRRFRTPVVAHVVDGVPHAVTDRPWRLNFSEGAPVTVTHRGEAVDGRATLLPLSAPDVGTFMRRALDNGESPRALGLRVRRGHAVTAAELAALGQSVIRFDLPGATSF